MDPKKLDRRSFVELAALGLTAFTAAPPLGWIESRLPKSLAAPPRPLATFVRSDVYSTAGQAMLASYRAGVAAMRARSTANPNDPTGWDYQWKMHGTYDPTTKSAWKTCQHGNFYFVIWHRMYLYYFERIVRQASGDPNFALPYWNYEPAAKRKLPPEFRSNTPPNALYFAARGPGINAGTAEIPAFSADPSYALGAMQFDGAEPGGFGGGVVPAPVHFMGDFGRLEMRPHNYVHGDVGGDMGDPNTAANDPIFWLHHANIDRLWSLWKSIDPTAHKDSSDSGWMNTPFTFFDENGAAVQMKGADVLDTVGQLGYRYDTEFKLDPRIVAQLRDRYRRLPPPWQYDWRHFKPPIPWPPDPPAPWRTLGIERSRPVTITSVLTVTTITLGRETVAGLRSALAANSRVTPLLVLEGLSVRRPPGGTLDVFLLPGSQSAASASRIATQSPRGIFAGRVDFFGVFGQFGTPEGVRNATLAVDVSDVLREQLGRVNARDGTMTVLFQFRGPTSTERGAVQGPAQAIQIGSVSVRVAGVRR